VGLDFTDNSEYSDDGLYRWCYERRWADGPGLCWIGLNPSTGDTTGRPRPTLAKVVARAQAAGLGAVTVVNLFSWRATRPADLKAALRSGHDVIGERTDRVIADRSRHSAITLVAWGCHGTLLSRGHQVAALIAQPWCLGTTSTGEPRHPLFVSPSVSMSRYSTDMVDGV